MLYVYKIVYSLIIVIYKNIFLIYVVKILIGVFLVMDIYIYGILYFCFNVWF